MIRINTTFKELWDFTLSIDALVILAFIFLFPRGDNSNVEESPSTRTAETEVENSISEQAPATLEQEVKTDESSQAPANLQRVWVVTVSADDTLNVRKGGNWQQELICEVDPEVSVEVIEEAHNGWWRIKASDICSGWVNSQYLREEFRP